MKRKRKNFIFAFFGSGFFVYFCMTALNFQYVCDFQERAINDLSLQSKKSSKSSAGTSFCLQLYATLYTFCKEENMSLTQSLISNLSSTFDIPRKQLHLDNMMLISELPLFCCNLHDYYYFIIIQKIIFVIAVYADKICIVSYHSTLPQS